MRSCEAVQGGDFGASAQEPTPVAIASGDVTLRADAFGDPRDVPVVLLHGGGQTRHSWRATGADLAAEGWYVLAVDHRGHGDSDWSPEGRYDSQAMASDVANIVDHLGARPVLVGASLGGTASLAALGHNPELALGLVLVDVSPFLQSKGRERIVSFMTANPEGFASLDEMADAVAAYLPHRRRPNDLNGLRNNMRERNGRIFWHWDPAFLNTATDDAVGRDIDSGLLAAAAAVLRFPTLLVRGAESDVLSREDARRFLDLVPHADFCEIADARHMVAGDENTGFGSVLGDFLERRIRPRCQLLAELQLDRGD